VRLLIIRRRSAYAFPDSGLRSAVYGASSGCLARNSYDKPIHTAIVWENEVADAHNSFNGTKTPSSNSDSNTTSPRSSS